MMFRYAFLAVFVMGAMACSSVPHRSTPPDPRGECIEEWARDAYLVATEVKSYADRYSDNQVVLQGLPPQPIELSEVGQWYSQMTNYERKAWEEQLRLSELIPERVVDLWLLTGFGDPVASYDISEVTRNASSIVARYGEFIEANSCLDRRVLIRWAVPRNLSLWCNTEYHQTVLAFLKNEVHFNGAPFVSSQQMHIGGKFDGQMGLQCSAWQEWIIEDFAPNAVWDPVLEKFVRESGVAKAPFRWPTPTKVSG